MIEILVNAGTNQPNRSLDVFQDEVFTINYEIANIQDITNSGGSYTKSLQLPNTQNNKTIFGYVTDMAVDLGHNYYTNHSNSFNPNKKIQCWVLENTIPILQGHIQLTDFDINSIENNTSLNVTIYADNANFYIEMGDKLLTDIDFSEYSFTYSRTEIIGSWTNSTDAFKTGKYFPLIDYGHGWTLDDLNNSALYRLGVKDFLPAVYVKTIWDKVFSSNDYLCSSAFAGSGRTMPDPRFGNLIIPFNNQSFQTGPFFNQDKIFHVGLSHTTIGQYTTFSAGPYKNSLNNKVTGVTGVAWYDGYLLSPFQFYYDRNSGTISSTYVYDQQNIPFGNTAAPMFDPNVGGQYIYDTSVPADMLYVNTYTASVYKQRFVLKTDIVTTYSNNGNFVHLAQDTPDYLKYVCYVNFFREIDPVTGTMSIDWLSGTGCVIPPDLGFQNSGSSYSIAASIDKHWICDDSGNSNCFDSSGKLIVPTGASGGSRYLGKYAISNRGYRAEEADDSATAYYQMTSGNVPSWYYNDGWYAGSYLTPQQGLWTSGNVPAYNPPASAFMPCNGDWYQQLQLQTIFLDGDTLDPFYGAAGTVKPLGNTPLFPGEHVRCMIFFGGKYYGLEGSFLGYRPPSSATMLTYTNFYGDTPYPYGTYQNPVGLNTPLTQFYNEVSNDYIEGMKVDFNDCIPKNVKQRDFIQDIVHLHNLYIEPSKTNPKTLIIEPREDYYLLATQSLDWSTKLDLTQPVNVQVLAETQNKRTTFTYKADNDFYNKMYTQNTNEIYGQFINQIDNDYLTGETKIESMFSPTPLSTLYSFFGDAGGDSIARTGGFVLPVFVNGSNVKPSSNSGANGTVQVNYRLLYKNYLSNLNSDTITIFGTPTHNYPYAGPYDNPYTPTYTVNWGQTLGEFFNSATDQFSGNLVNTYWAGILTEITDMDSRIITCYMFLTPKDINNFYFYNLVFVTIGGVDGFYKVNSIEDYVPGRNSICKVTLLRSNTFLAPNTYSGSIG